MPVPNLFQIFIDPLNRAGIDYMITGSVASMIYGEPRFTNDIDLVIRLNTDDALKLEQFFPLEAFYVPPVESLRMEIRRLNRGHFNLIHHQTGFKADIYLEGRDSLHVWAMSLRREMEMMGHHLWVAPPEYVIIRKLDFYLEGGSSKHLSDIENMLRMTDLDEEALQKRLNDKAGEVLAKIKSGMTNYRDGAPDFER